MQDLKAKPQTKKSEQLRDEYAQALSEEIAEKRAVEALKPPKTYTQTELNRLLKDAVEEQQDIDCDIIQSALKPLLYFDDMLENLEVSDRADWTKETHIIKKMLALGACVWGQKEIKYNLHGIADINLDVDAEGRRVFLP